MSHLLYGVRGESMSPSFYDGDLLVVDSQAYRNHKPRRSDVIVVIDPEGSGRHTLKRVIGLPGESVSLSDGSLWIDREPIHEPYLNGRPSSLGLGRSSWELNGDEFFVLGDNRSHSTDSRTYGPLAVDSFIGKAVIRLWPFRRVGRL